MSVKERRRLLVMSQVDSGDLTVAGAGLALGVSERQARRIWKRYRVLGDGGLVHRLRGRPGNRRTDSSVRRQAVLLYREHYGDFGCTLASEYLAERHGLKVKISTLRRWLLAEGLWHRRHGSPVRRRRRERRACFGELVQIDGSDHDWFEGRGKRCVLMVMIDDATSWTWAQFFPAETTEGAMTLLRQWAMRHGLPVALYPDRDSIYRVNTSRADELERRTGRRPLTQFGRAMGELGVRIICAHSPQAKGRVERMNGTLQDRLVKALRVKGISDMARANAYLRDVFLPQLNARFSVAAAERADAHLAVDGAVLEESLCIKEDRVVGRDHCVSLGGVVLQLRPGKGMGSLSGKHVEVRRALEGSILVLWRGRRVAHSPAMDRPPAARKPAPLIERVAAHQGSYKPPADHPWRGPFKGGVRGIERWRLEPCSAAVSSPRARRPALRKAPTPVGG